MNRIKLIVAALCVLGLSLTANSKTIDLALMLDESGSIGTTNFNLQKSAYQNIFASGSFYTNFVTAGDVLNVAAWTFDGGQISRIGWTAITSDATAVAFGNQFAAIPYNGGGTDIAGAINTAAASLNGRTGADKKIIDISTDGQSNYTSAVNAATAANANQITVNMIGVGSGISTTLLQGVTNAAGGFYMTTSDFASFENALKRKLHKEIQGVPEPASIALLGLGLLSVGFFARKKRS